jgi:uncharacterized protein (DUF1015 family)
MLKKEWKEYLKRCTEELRDRVEYEMEEGLKNEVFSLEDLKLWTLDDFILFAQEVNMYYFL